MWVEDLAAEEDPVAVLVEESALGQGTGVGCGSALPSHVPGRGRRPDRTAPPGNSRRVEILKLLLDEMYPPALAEALPRWRGIDACTVAGGGRLAGRSDLDVMAKPPWQTGYTCCLTENVADFVRIASDHLSTGGHHPGVLVAPSSGSHAVPAGSNAIAAGGPRLSAATDLDDRLYIPRLTASARLGN